MEGFPIKYLALPLFHLERASYTGSRVQWQVLLAVALQGAECSDCRNMLLFLVQFGTQVIFHCLLAALLFSAEKKHAEAHSHSLLAHQFCPSWNQKM